ncbi:hypothetical protein RD792_014489 [Penstemon davidsonii]|uniref:Major facilitator superfamily (MFS) profile domain-containing protein n=1 Tax=Penstemon davidsonii TaxID=160366 RepID=A0ABR0CQ54_9LAMI|nr:hypothetical protein RD792_014489 [Penstemon davidsonii]
MGDHQRLGFTLDEALSSLGFGTFQSLALVFAGIGWFSEAMEMTLLSFIGPAVKSQWSLSPTEESLISTAVFGGMLIGAYLWGFISDTYGRRTGIRGVVVVVAGAGFLSAFSPNYISLVILRCLLGFGVAGGHVFGSWFLEFIPSSNRGAWMLSMLVFWILGELFEASLAWLIMPRLGWRWLLALSSIPSFLAVIFSTFIPESPSGHSLCGSIITLSENVQDVSLYRNVLITCSAEIPGLVIATVLMDRVGRKLTMESLSILTVILLIPLTFHQNEIVTTSLLFGARMLLFAALSSLTIYAKEVYPTSIRASGSGLATSVGRIGGMICPLVAVGLVRGCHQTIAVVLFGIVIIISGICVLFFPFETKGRGLEDIMADSNPVYTLDEALTTIGFGKYQGLLLAYGGLGWIAEAMEMMILSFIGSAVQSEWNLSPGEKSFISTAVFAGMLVGAFSWGAISDTYGRKKGILGVASITAIAGLLSAFSPNYTSLIIIRCIAGVGLGGMHIFTSWFLEFVPTPNRGAWMIVFSSFWTLGTIFEAGLAWIIMPVFGWRWLVALSSIPSFIVLLFYVLTPESPRYLYTKGKIDEARIVLKKAALLNGTILQNGTLVSDQFEDHETTTSENTHLLSQKEKTNNYETSSSSLSILFSSRLIRTNLLLWFLYFGNTFSYYGIILLTSELSSGQSKCTTITLNSEKSQNASLYVDVFVTSLAELPGLVLSTFIVDRVGRKPSMVLMFVLGFVLLLPLMVHRNEILTTTLLFGARTFISATFVVACIYAPEVYPTSARTTGVGIATAIGRIGGMICPLVAVGLVNGCHQASAIVLFEITILLSGLSVWLSPFETNRRNLADTIVL